MASVSVPKSSSIPRSCLQNSGSKSMEIACRDHCLMHGVLFPSLSGAQLLWAYPSMLIVLNPSASSLPVSYVKDVMQGWGICKASPKVAILCAFSHHLNKFLRTSPSLIYTETGYIWLAHPLLGICTSASLNPLPAHHSFPCFQLLVKTFLLLSLFPFISHYPLSHPLSSLSPSHAGNPSTSTSFYLETTGVVVVSFNWDIYAVNSTSTRSLYLYPGTLVIGQLFKVFCGIKINPHLNQSREKL